MTVNSTIMPLPSQQADDSSASLLIITDIKHYKCKRYFSQFGENMSTWLLAKSSKGD